jgi:MSHA biogenesis protein MshM
VYREHFGLKDRPFIHAPGERFFAANAGMSDALARLRHVLSARDSVAVVTGGPGVGKSSLAEHAVAGLEGGTVARVDMRYAEGEEIYAAILLALGESDTALRPAHGLNALRQAMARLAKEGRRLVLSLDSGGITADLAKHLLRVVNLSGETGCQMNLVLMGPHPLHQQVDVPAMIQLRQRIAFRYRVRPLTLAETDRYVRHQLEAAGADPSTLLSGNVSAAVYCYVAGVPRLINTLLDAALGEACTQDLQRPDGSVIKRTADGLGWKPMMPSQAGPDAAARPRPQPARPATPKVAVVATSVVERRDAQHTETAKRADAPASDVTLQLRADPAAASSTVMLSSEAASPTAALFGRGDAPAVAPPVPMDEVDTGATGMLRLQDLDERFAETIFGKEAGK